MSAFFVSALLIFVAELGDKSQLVALWFATRYRWWLVVAGVSTATLVVHLGSVAIGLAFDELLPERWLLTLVGLSFFGFAAWSLRGDALDGEPAEPRLGAKFGAFGVVTGAFFLSELGDKTMLATVSLAGRESSAVGSGWARRWGWCWPMRWRSRSGCWRGSGCRSERSRSGRPRCSWPSVRRRSGRGGGYGHPRRRMAMADRRSEAAAQAVIAAREVPRWVPGRFVAVARMASAT